jgi:hypothetical protein
VLKENREEVYSLDAGNRVRIRNVEVGLRGSKLAEIKNGLEPLGDHLKTGHLWSLQNRPLWMV